ncbi:MAG: NlpC/P60 family protein [Ilumatobacter sp.]|uniref:C40 family peptidase n=1 Tax=Ilumatobacter sp. TaxID=1967498 RepID=UPI00391A6B61
MVSVVVPTMHPGLASASPVEQQRQRVENIVDELERLEEQALRIGEEYTAALDDQRLLAEEIVDLEADIAAQEVELDTLRSDLGEMAVRSFIGTGRAPLGPLFEESANLNDVLQRDELARAALSAGDVTTDEIDAYVSDLEDDRTELENKRRQAEQLAASLVSAQEETERLRAEYQQARIDAEAELGQLIVEEEQRRAAESAARIQAEIAASQNASSNSGSNSSGSNSSGSNDSGSNSSGSNDSGSSGTTNTSGGSSGSSGDSGSSSGGGSSAPPVSSLASVAVNAALNQQGVPYRYATSSPGVAFDCSGLTKYAWGKAGVYLPHQSAQQFASIPHVSKDAAQPGDLLFYYSPISHVGVYLGGGQLVHAPATGDVVKIASVNWSKVSGVGRPG